MAIHCRISFLEESRSRGMANLHSEEPRCDKIHSPGNQGVKKGPGPRGSRDEEFLMTSLVITILLRKP